MAGVALSPQVVTREQKVAEAQDQGAAVALAAFIPSAVVTALSALGFLITKDPPGFPCSSLAQ